jgi:hypothetical protein
MILKTDEVRKKVGHYRTSGANCAPVAEQMIRDLFAGPCEYKETVRCKTLEEAINAIKTFTTDTTLASMYPSSGFDEKGNPVWHAYIVYGASPLESCAPWSDKVDYYDECKTKDFIEKTLSCARHGNIIEVHKWGKI